MGNYFLIKERNYCKIDNVFMGKDTNLLPGSYATHSEAIQAAGKEQEMIQEQNSTSVIYVVEIVDKFFGCAKRKEF